MLTPVDIQQKKFKGGLGYNKDDVNTFFEEVHRSYEELYRSNADLKEKVITLTDELQHYKITEENLEKSLLLAEKNSEEQRTNAEIAARNIELEAKNRAREIVKNAEADLKDMQKAMQELRSRYAEYKSAFATLCQEHFHFLEVNDIDADAFIDPSYGASKPSANSEFPFESWDGDDNGGGGLGSASAVGKTREENRSSSTNVYGSTLGGTGIDPFLKLKES